MLRLTRLAALLALAVSPAWAGSPMNATLPLTASVADSCVIVSADSLMFGAYSPISGMAATTTGQLQLRCTKGATFTVVPTSGGSALTSAKGTLAYALYTDSAMSKQWGTPHSAGTVAFNSNAKYAGGNGTGVLALFQTRLTAAQFAANPDYVNQPYAITKTGTNTYSYSVNYVGQPTDPNSLGSMAAAYPGSTYVNVANNVRVGNAGALPTTTDVSVFVLPASTPVNGTVYQVSTGFVDTTNLAGTATSGLSNQALTYYGKVPANQDMAPGAYTDTVIFTVSF